MKNIWIKAVAFCVISLAVASCSRSFEEINTDTSKIIEPTPASLLAPIQYNMASNAYLRANDFTFDIMQIAIDFPGEGNNISRYYVTESTGNSYWNTSYKWLMQVKQMQDLAVQQNNKNYQAISMVMNAWLYSNLTDTFGDIPFSEASRVEEGITQPKFDKQKDIYVKLLDDLNIKQLRLIEKSLYEINIKELKISVSKFFSEIAKINNFAGTQFINLKTNNLIQLLFVSGLNF